MAYQVRAAKEADIPRMLELFEGAVRRMRAEGNLTQWKDYPKRELLLSDIEKQQSFLITEGEEIIGTFVFMLREEPTYRVIEDGAWLNDQAYGTIHRIAGDGIHHGILRTAVEYAGRYTGNIRLDTHEKNRSMQAAAKALGFIRCGIIYVADANSDHEPRIAYQRIREC